MQTFLSKCSLVKICQLIYFCQVNWFKLNYILLDTCSKLVRCQKFLVVINLQEKKTIYHEKSYQFNLFITYFGNNFEATQFCKQNFKLFEIKFVKLKSYLSSQLNSNWIIVFLPLFLIYLSNSLRKIVKSLFKQSIV